MQKTNYLEALILDYLLTAKAVTRPSAVYLALHTADPTETGAVGELTPGNGYARQAVSFNDAAQPYVNAADVLFGPCTGVAWGNITHATLWTAPTGGNPLYYGALTAARTIAVSDELKFAAGQISVDEA